MIVVRSARMPWNGWPMEHVGIGRSVPPASSAYASSVVTVAAAYARPSHPSFLSQRLGFFFLKKNSLDYNFSLPSFFLFLLNL